MAYILKATKTLFHDYSEVPISGAYAIVDDIFINKKERRASFNLLIYINRSARLNNMKPISAFSIAATTADFIAYFSPSLTTAIWAQVNNYLANGGGLATTGLVAADWQVDPQTEP